MAAPSWLDLVAFDHLQFSQIRGRQPYSIVRNILYVIDRRATSLTFIEAFVAYQL
jgi:hypothetical protein